jgi:inosose dehydratase
LALRSPLTALAAAGVRNPVGCQTNAWQIKPGDFRDLLSRLADLKRLGFEAFECNVRFVQEQFANAQKARAQIQGLGVRFYGPHTGIRFGVDELQRLVDGAAAVGAEHFVLSGAGGTVKKDQALDQDALGKKLDTLERVGKHCRKAGLRLVYHNHRQEFTSGGAEIEELVRRCDPELVFFLLDIGHAFNEQADVPAFFTRHHQRIDALHLRDVREGKQVPLGQGQLDFAALAAAIRKTAWPGWLIVEEEALKSADNRYVESVLESDRRMIRKTFGV